MKNAKKLFAVLLALLMCMSFASCSEESSGGGGGRGSSKSLYEHGMDVIALMAEKANSDAYLDLYVSYRDDGMASPLALIRDKDYENPSAVYEISYDEEALFAAMDQQKKMEDLPESLKAEVMGKYRASLPTMFNSQFGSSAVMLHSVFASSKLFVSNAQADVMYLYLFEDAAPVLVSFTEGEDGAVSAVGGFLFKEMTDADELFEGISEDIEEIVKLEKIK